MNEEAARRRFSFTAPLDLGSFCIVRLLWLTFDTHSEQLFTIEQLIASLEATTTLTKLSVEFSGFESTPENNRRFLEPLCRCIANLRQHNQNHPLRRLGLFYSENVHEIDIEPFLIAAKQFGIHHLKIAYIARFPIQSLEDFCRDNTYLKDLEIIYVTYFGGESTLSAKSVELPHDSSAVLAMDKLTINNVQFENSTVATKFLNTIAHATYTELELGSTRCWDYDYEQEKKILSEFIKPSVQELNLGHGCGIEVMDVIESCATITQIQMDDSFPPTDCRRLKLQTVATRNRELALFVASPRVYPGDMLLKLLRQFDNSPTGRYMLARCFAEIPYFFKINKSTDPSTAGPKKRKRRS